MGLTEAKLAKMEIMNRGTVLKKQTRIRKIHPVIRLPFNSAEDLFKFSQILVA